MAASLPYPITFLSGSLLFCLTAAVFAQGAASDDEIGRRASRVECKVIDWRRDIHPPPELGDQEQPTAKLVAEHLKQFSIEVKTNIARTGVIGILEGGQAGKTAALRTDLDALPVTELAGLSFASKARQKYQGQEVDVMRAREHDAHTAMLMGTAEVLAGLNSANQNPATAVPNHNPRFFMNEAARVTGVQAMSSTATSFLNEP
jgi:metal-dependent amidase/aminoacylase/carboxypeptidase family protein